jgi:hypothetical protein
MLIAERVAELVNPQQPSAAVFAVEFSIEVHGAARNGPVWQLGPESIPDCVGEPGDPVEAAHHNLPRTQRVDASAACGTLDLDRCEAREHAA